MTQLATRRLILRPLTKLDLPGVVAGLGNFNVAKMTSRVPHPYGLADAEAYLAKTRAGGVGTLHLMMVRHEEPQRVIGGIGLEPVQYGSGLEIGFWLAEPHWGQGLATEASRAVVDHAFAVMDAPCIIARYRNDNPASGRVQAKLGFIKIEDTTCGSKADPANHPATRTELRRSAWVALRGGAA